MSWYVWNESQLGGSNWSWAKFCNDLMSARGIKWGIFISKGIWDFYLDPDVWWVSLNIKIPYSGYFFKKVVQKNHSDCNLIAIYFWRFFYKVKIDAQTSILESEKENLKLNWIKV